MKSLILSIVMGCSLMAADNGLDSAKKRAIEELNARIKIHQDAVACVEKATTIQEFKICRDKSQKSLELIKLQSQKEAIEAKQNALKGGHQ